MAKVKAPYPIYFFLNKIASVSAIAYSIGFEYLNTSTIG